MLTVIEYQEKANALAVQQQEVIKKADVEKRSLNAGDKEQIDRIDLLIDGILKEKDIVEKVEKRSILMKAPAPVEGKKTKLKITDYTKLAPVKRRSTKRYLTEFRSHLLHANKGKQIETRAMSMDDFTEGGALIAPMKMSDQYIKAIDDEVYIRKWATIESVVGFHSLGIRARTARASAADWTSELDEATEDNSLRFGRRELEPKQLKKLIKISEKLLLHGGMLVEDIINQEMNYLFAITLENAYLTGNGANKPLGVFVASNDGISTARDITAGTNAGVITDTGLIDAFYGLKTQYRTRSTTKFIMHRERIRDIRKIKDLQGQFVWHPGITVGAEGSILGVEVVTSEFAPNSTASGAYWAVLGDWKFYTCADSKTMTMLRLNEIYRTGGQVGFLATCWHDGMPTLEEAFVRLKYA